MNDSKLIIFSAPSGAGKTTIVRHLLQNNPDLEFSISATTRAQRPTEVHGRDYYFISLEEFKEKIEQGDFVEYQQVYENVYYGTLKSEIERIHRKGHHVIFDVDVKGGITLKSFFKEKALAVFVKAPSVSELQKRLDIRGDSETNKAERLAKAPEENTLADQFDTVLINDNLHETFAKAQALVNRFLRKIVQ